MLSRIAMACCQASARADVGPSVRTYPFLPTIHPSNIIIIITTIID